MDPVFVEVDESGAVVKVRDAEVTDGRDAIRVLGDDLQGYIPPKETSWVNQGVYVFAKRLRSVPHVFEGEEAIVDQE